MKPNYPAIILGIVILILLMMRGCDQDSIKSLNSINAALADSLHYTKNKLGQETASRLAIQSDRDFFKRQANAINDPYIKRLAAEIQKATVSLTKVKTETTGSGGGWPEMWGDSCDETYHGKFVSVWDSIDITAGRKGIKYSYEVYNEFKVEQFLKSRGLFKKKDLTVSVTNLNPNTRTLALQSFHVNYPIKRIGVGPVVGVGINSSFMPEPFVGIGIQYSLIHF